MGFLSKFEGKMEDTLEGAADHMVKSPISPVQIAKKAEKKMRREKMVGAGKQYAPTLYTVLVNADDDERLFGYYPTLAGETETYLAAKAAEEAKKAQGYETGITYEQLARTPDDFEGEKVKFSGKVVQVMEGGSDIQIRLAVNDSYDTIVYGSYSPDTVSSRVLEDDHVTIYGTSVGTISYKSTMGGTITIPGVLIEKIDQ